MDLQDPHLIPKDPVRWVVLARHLRENPDDFSIALENIDRWEQWGRTHPAPLHEWRCRIAKAQSSADAMESFLTWLAEDNADAEPLKSCSPFVGILPRPVRP